MLISGTGTNLQALINAEHKGILGGTIVHVFSNRATAMGLKRATSANIDTTVISYADYQQSATPKVDYDDALVTAVNASEPDLVILAGFMRILTPRFLGDVSAPVMNLHPALPGCYAGLNAMERAWSDHTRNEIRESGVMVHEVVEEVDVGPVIGTKVLPMAPFDSFETFKAAMHDLEHALLVEVVQEWCSKFSET